MANPRRYSMEVEDALSDVGSLVDYPLQPWTASVGAEGQEASCLGFTWKAVSITGFSRSSRAPLAVQVLLVLVDFEVKLFSPLPLIGATWGRLRVSEPRGAPKDKSLAWKPGIHRPFRCCPGLSSLPCLLRPPSPNTPYPGQMNPSIHGLDATMPTTRAETHESIVDESSKTPAAKRLSCRGTFGGSLRWKGLITTR
ncbi:hypothetical protein CMUS01_09683 [Colletotrichum musicola]|uniref:Uncharacterized protein n=1 Tax=Colletotrichum musicola TaxID=2175873 RepID=A0A8H6NAT6_9PEZI|nr:hypothetical protein CMUS01_09683 [Colletotrichum musicola]